METKTYAQIKQMFTDKAYKFFTGHRNLNIFAVRKKISTNLFDDLLYVVYEDSGVKTVRSFPCTTDAGITFLRKPIHPQGTAIIVPGQYLGVYAIGRHTTYTALRQMRPMLYWRDNNRDTHHDMSGKVYTDIALTNIHKAGTNSTLINGNSAGCIVLKNSTNFDTLMELARNSAVIYGNSFTFTLFSEV